MKIGICQTVCLDGDRNGNFARIERAVAEAAERGADLACLPETAVYGWINPEAHDRVSAIPGEDSDRLEQIAAKYGVFLCAGLAEKDNGDLYDSAVLVDNEGRVVCKHRKINLLSELMEPPYHPGDSIKAVDTKWGRIGVLICADTHDDGILTEMAECGPDLLLVPYGYAEAEQNWPRHGKKLENVVCHASERTGAVTVGTNCVGQISNGPWKGRVYGGQSVAADTHGKVVARAADRDRDVVVFEIDPKEILMKKNL